MTYQYDRLRTLDMVRRVTDGMWGAGLRVSALCALTRSLRAPLSKNYRWRTLRCTRWGTCRLHIRDVGGEPLTVTYLLEDPAHCKWGFGGESRHTLSNKLRGLRHVRLRGKGSPVVYRYDDLRKYVDEHMDDS